MSNLSFYNFILTIYSLLLKIASLLGHRKAISFLSYRTQQSVSTFEETHIWIHAASAGEGNQAIPFSKILKEKYGYRVSISFFSPSGYEFHKNSSHFDQVINLPIDKPNSISNWVHQLQPDAALFIRKELWLNSLKTLKSHSIPVFLVNADPKTLFNKKFLNSFHIKCLKLFNRIYLTQSYETPLPKALDVSPIYGDTKYESSFAISSKSKNDRLANFSKQHFTVVVGSSWIAEEKLVEQFLQDYNTSKVRFIIAPHEIHDKRIQALQNRFIGNSILYTDPISNPDSQIMILNEMGLLKHVYPYGQLAIIGGGMGKGIHNILEAVSHYKPVLFGPNHTAFPEAVELKKQHLAYSYENYNQFKKHLISLIENIDQIDNISNQLKIFTEQHKNIAEQIIEDIMPIIRQ